MRRGVIGGGVETAARRLGKRRMEAMHDAAREIVEDVRLDQRLFQLSEADNEAFVACLNEYAEPTEALRKVLSAKTPWEQ